MNDVLLAFALTLVAGMATAIGSAVAFFAKRTSYRFLSVAAGFSAGVMLYVSFVEILVKGNQSLTVAYGDWGPWVNAAAFFGGILLIALIDNLIPSAENPHEPHSRAETASLHDEPAGHAAPTSAGVARGQNVVSAPAHELRHQHLMRMGLFTALAIGIHNFPEGMATFFAALQDPAIGIAIAVAVALHNIPEGVSVSVPIFYATGSRKRAFTYSVLSGLAEPVGALLAFVALRLLVGSGNGTLPPQVMGVLFAGVAGIMVYISLDQLLPTSRAYGKGHDSLLGIIAGMLVMALSLLILS